MTSEDSLKVYVFKFDSTIQKCYFNEISFLKISYILHFNPPHCLLSTVFQAITKELFDEALRALADEDFLTVTGKTVRLLA